VLTCIRQHKKQARAHSCVARPSLVWEAAPRRADCLYPTTR
jgi:hypothetical protein